MCCKEVGSQESIRYEWRLFAHSPEEVPTDEYNHFLLPGICSDHFVDDCLQDTCVLVITGCVHYSDKKIGM